MCYMLLCALLCLRLVQVGVLLLLLCLARLCALAPLARRTPSEHGVMPVGARPLRLAQMRLLPLRPCVLQCSVLGLGLILVSVLCLRFPCVRMLHMHQASPLCGVGRVLVLFQLLLFLKRLHLHLVLPL